MADESIDRPRLLPLVKALFAMLLLLLFIPLSGYAFAQASETSQAGISFGQLSLLAVLLLFSGLMSGSETALTAMGQWKIRQLREEGQDPRGLFALLERDPTRFITTILIMNNLLNIAATALVTQIALDIAQAIGRPEAVAVAYATGIMTLLVLVFGEITPKSFAVHNAEAMSRVVIMPVYLLSVVFYPIGLFFTFLTTRVLRLFRLEPADSPLITENELRLMLRSAEESGVIAAQEEEMIKGVIDLEETVVREVMTPRVDVVAVETDKTLDELLPIVDTYNYSRLPVFKETTDDIQGVVYTRDLIAFLNRSEELKTTTVGEVMIPAQFVPETLNILSLLREMKAGKSHLAVVVDEFGGTSGIVTLEDIIEEVTGEIYDETDSEAEEHIIALGDDVYRIQGSVHMDEVAELFKLSVDDDGEYDTVAGFLIRAFGYIPQAAESLVYDGVRFRIEEADERRIITIQAEPERSAESD